MNVKINVKMNEDKMNDTGKKKTICVYSSSSEAIDKNYFRAAEELGRVLANSKCPVVYGAGAIGLMGAMARAVHENGGTVTGVIPEELNRRGIVYEEADQLIVTKTMRERKQIMEDLADGFIVLPGGFGTLEEFLEILTLKQLRYHDKPIVVLDVNGFYRDLLAMFEHIYSEHFAKPDYREFYYVTADAADALDHIENYSPPKVMEKWFGLAKVDEKKPAAQDEEALNALE